MVAKRKFQFGFGRMLRCACCFLPSPPLRHSGGNNHQDLELVSFPDTVPLADRQAGTVQSEEEISNQHQIDDAEEPKDTEQPPISQRSPEEKEIHTFTDKYIVRRRNDRTESKGTIKTRGRRLGSSSTASGSGQNRIRQYSRITLNLSEDKVNDLKNLYDVLKKNPELFDDIRHLHIVGPSFAEEYEKYYNSMSDSNHDDIITEEFDPAEFELFFLTGLIRSAESRAHRGLFILDMGRVVLQHLNDRTTALLIRLMTVSRKIRVISLPVCCSCPTLRQFLDRLGDFKWELPSLVLVNSPYSDLALQTNDWISQSSFTSSDKSSENLRINLYLNSLEIRNMSEKKLQETLIYNRCPILLSYLQELLIFGPEEIWVTNAFEKLTRRSSPNLISIIWDIENLPTTTDSLPENDPDYYQSDPVFLFRLTLSFPMTHTESGLTIAFHILRSVRFRIRTQQLEDLNLVYSSKSKSICSKLKVPNTSTDMEQLKHILRQVEREFNTVYTKSAFPNLRKIRLFIIVGESGGGGCDGVQNIQPNCVGSHPVPMPDLIEHHVQVEKIKPLSDSNSEHSNWLPSNDRNSSDSWAGGDGVGVSNIQLNLPGSHSVYKPVIEPNLDDKNVQVEKVKPFADSNSENSNWHSSNDCGDGDGGEILNIQPNLHGSNPIPVPVLEPNLDDSHVQDEKAKFLADSNSEISNWLPFNDWHSSDAWALAKEMAPSMHGTKKLLVRIGSDIEARDFLESVALRSFKQSQWDI